MEKKEADRKEFSEKYIRWLSELDKNSGHIAGGKGANLAEMYNAKFPVPPAFIITAQAFDLHLKRSGLKQKIAEIIAKTDVDNTKELEKNAKEIRVLIEKTSLEKDMEEEIGEAYQTLCAENIDEMTSNKKPKDIFVAVRSSATTEDLSSASFAGQQETYTNIRGIDSLLHAVKKCFASLYTARAVYYRHKKGFDKANALLSAVVQKMINSEKSGVMFTKNPANGKDEIIIESVFGLGEGIVSGRILPDQYILNPKLELMSKKVNDKKIEMIKEENGNGLVVELPENKRKRQVLSDAEIRTLAHYGKKIEEHYGKPQDIEFAVENEKIYIVQSRPVTTIGTEKKEISVHGIILLEGLAASPGIASGIVRIVKDMDDLDKIKRGEVLVTKMTNPDMVVTMQKAVAIITDEGGATSHAAIVSREMGIPCVVGTEKATKELKDGMEVSVDGTNGKVYEGKAKEGAPKKEILPIVHGTKTKIKVIVDLPDYAERASKTNCSSVGLVRLEGIIASSGKHPVAFSREKNVEEYSLIIEKGIEKIASHFKEIWIRTSDIRSDEYKHLKGAPRENELNPMLGFHGIRFSLKHKDIFEAEISAIKKVAETYPEKKFGIMFPQVINENEIQEAFNVFRKFQRNNMTMGAMIETPAAVQIIREICKYVKFISFGTNDLTQFTLALDRGNPEVQYLYDETHPAIIRQIKKVIKVCKEYGVETSICGQAGSKPEMAKKLVKLGIDSISTNADMAHDISKMIKDIESLPIEEN
jgi:pyruvate,water dikinase